MTTILYSLSQYMVLTISHFSMLLLRVHSYTHVLSYCTLLTCIRGVIFIVLGGGWGRQLTVQSQFLGAPDAQSVLNPLYGADSLPFIKGGGARSTTPRILLYINQFCLCYSHPVFSTFWPNLFVTFHLSIFSVIFHALPCRRSQDCGGFSSIIPIYPA